MKLLKYFLLNIYFLIISGCMSDLRAQLISEWSKVLQVDSASFCFSTGITTDRKLNSFITGMIRLPATGNDMILAKYDPSGTLKWLRFFDGGSGYDDSATAVKADYQDNLLITGKSFTDSSGFDFLTNKYDTSGNLLWSKRWISEANYSDIPRFLASDGMGNVYVCGFTQYGDNSAIRVIKYSKTGTQIYQYTYSGPAFLDYPEDMYVSNSGYVYIAGRSLGIGTSYEYVIIKLTPQGSESWIKKYNRGPWYDVANRITADPEGNVYVTGGSMNGVAGRSTYDIYTIKYDQNGNEIFSHNFDSPDHSFDYPMGIAVDESGNTYIGGISEKSDGNLNWVIYKLNQWGWNSPDWVRYFDGSAHALDSMTSLSIFHQYDDSYILTAFGYTTSLFSGMDFITVRYDGNYGYIKGVARYDNSNQCDRQTAGATDISGKTYMTGFLGGEGSKCEIETVKYSQYDDQNAYNYMLLDSSSGQYYVNLSAAAGDHLFILKDYGYEPSTDSSRFLALYDISDAADLRFIDTLKIKKDGELQTGSCMVSDSLLFLTQYNQGLYIYNISDPYNTVFLNKIQKSNGSYFNKMCIKGEILFIADWEKIIIIDISDPAYPFEAGAVSVGDNTEISDIRIQGNYLFAAKAFSLTILDISNPSFPVTVASLPVEMYPSPVLLPSGNLLYCAESSMGSSLTLATLDISNPSDPLIISYSNLASAGKLIDLMMNDQFVYFVGSNQIRVLDKSDPLNLTEYGFYKLTSYNENKIAKLTGNTVVVGCSDGVYSLTNEVLAIKPELVSLSVTEDENYAVISWRLTSINKVKGFEVEKKSNLQEWQCIYSVNKEAVESSGGFFTMKDIKADETAIFYRIKVIFDDGYLSYSPSVELNRSLTPVFKLQSNYPNPFNPTTTISYSIPSPSDVTLKVFNISGEEILTAVNDFQMQGNYTVRLDLSFCPSGVYLARLQSGTSILNIKMILLK